MHHPSLKEFIGLSRKANVIPVYKEINADLDTPVSAFLKMDKDNYAFLLESAEGEEKIARYSFLGSNPSLIIKTKGKSIEIMRAGKKPQHFITKKTPLDEIRGLMRNFRVASVKGLPRFYGGLVGYIGYDMVRFFEKLPDKNQDELGLYDSIFILTDTILIFDHSRHSVKIVNNVVLPKGGGRLSPNRLSGFYYKALRKIESINSIFNKPLALMPATGHKRGKPGQRITSNFTKESFQKMVTKAKGYIKRGDIIQVVPSQRFKIKIGQEPFDIYRKLRSLNPSPYMFFLKLKDTVLIGSSPEMLVRYENGIARTRPIAGTRPRGKSEVEDKRLARELMRDAKERAEHIMLVDLGRNDLGRVCMPGKVRVSEFMKLEKYSHVMHLVSEVRGNASRKYDAYDVLRASFPAGTVSGSPKIRAMEIIDELENTRRGYYAGCVGYFSFSHNMDTCITIRTILVKNGTAYVQAGGGIVADSVPEKEYYESVNKAKALIEAIVN